MSVGMYVRKRTGTGNYAAQIIIPPDLRCAYGGRGQIWKTLKTGDKREADKRSTAVFAKYLAEFDAARRTRPATDADLQQAAYDHYVAELENDRRDRANLPKLRAASKRDREAIRAEIASGVIPNSGHLVELAAASDPLPLQRQMRQLRRKLAGEALAIGETVDVHWIADAVIAEQSLDIAKGSPAYVDLCQHLQRAELEALKRAEERDAGDWCGLPRAVTAQAGSYAS